VIGATPRTGVHVAIIAAALTVWAWSLPAIDPRRMQDLGLISVLPWTTGLALVGIVLSFCAAVWSTRVPAWALFLHIAALILVIHATPALTYGSLRYSWAWKHVGIIDYIQRNGSVDPSIGFLTAYHNWPGFFALGALMDQAAGLDLALDWATWAPVFFNLLFVSALLLVLRTFTRDRRLTWLGAWFFVLANWIGQDYFSPQAMAFFLYLVMLGVCLRWYQTMPRDFKVWSIVPPPVVRLYTGIVRRGAPADETTELQAPYQRVGLVAVVIALLAAITISHQLTPFMVLFDLTALVLARRLSLRGLPLLVGVMVAAWTVFMATAFLQGNLYWIVESLGRLGGNAEATLIDLSRASPGQRAVAIVDRVLTASIAVLAGLGLLRRWRNHEFDLVAVLLAVAPIPMLAANAYGGEMLFRVYLFSLPFTAFLAAGLVYPAEQQGSSMWALVSSSVLSVLLLGGLSLAYYGKEQMNYFSPGEVAAAEYLYSQAPPGSLFVGLTYYPWPYRDYELFSYRSLTEESTATLRRLMADPEDAIEAEIDTSDYPAVYVSITRSQRAYVDDMGLLPPGWEERLRVGLLASGRYQLLVDSPDATIFVRTSAP
jgi:hypothetical protein